MKALNVISLSVGLLMGCYAVPQRPIGSVFGIDRVEAGLSEAEKNSFVRQLVRDLRVRFGTNAILGIRTGGGRHGDRYTEQVRRFAERGAIAYREQSANFEIRFVETRSEGAISGPGIRTYEVTALLVRLKGINEGAEMLSTSTKRGWCRNRSGSAFDCNLVLRTLADQALYSMRLPGETS